VPASHLLLALQCGRLGRLLRHFRQPGAGRRGGPVVRHGGGAILSETPEIYGAEHLLTRRASRREVGEKLIRRIKWWEDYTARNGNEMNNQSLAGNKAGGPQHHLEKSLAPWPRRHHQSVDVYEYAERFTARGFVYLDTPGYDPCRRRTDRGRATLVCFTPARVRLRLQARAFAQAPHQHAPLDHQEEDMDLNCAPSSTARRA